MKIERLYEDEDLIFEKFEDGKYRVTFFNDENHWAGDIAFSKNEGVIYDDVKDNETYSKEATLNGIKEEIGPNSKKQFWEVVDDINWGSGINYKDVQNIPNRKENWNIAINYREKLQNAIRVYANENYKYFNDFLPISDDSFWDLTAHIVGLGETTYFNVLKNPELIKDYLSGPNKYRENFEYCFHDKKEE